MDVRGFIQDLAAFAMALCTRAAAYMTGGILVAAASVYFALGKSMPLWAVCALVSLAFFVAAFNAYRKQLRTIETLTVTANKKAVRNQLGGLRKALADRASRV